MLLGRPKYISHVGPNAATAISSSNDLSDKRPRRNLLTLRRCRFCDLTAMGQSISGGSDSSLDFGGKDCLDRLEDLDEIPSTLSWPFSSSLFLRRSSIKL